MSVRSQRSEDKVSRRKLIDRLLPAPQYGPLLGLVATTYEFQSEFFETDFLPTLLGLGAWDDRNWTSRVAIEKALAELEGAVVFTDAFRYQGRPRSLRVDVVPVALEAGAALHAKVALLVHRDAIRLHVASANLTEPGYRRNRELAAPLVASRTHPEQAGLIHSALEQMRAALSPWWTDTAERVVQMAFSVLSQLPVDVSEDQFLWGTATTSPWEKLLAAWPAGSLIDRMTIVSPFWAEEHGDRGPLVQLVRRLRERNALAMDAKVRLLAEAKHIGGESYMPILPESYASFDARRLGIVATAEAVDPTVLPQEVDEQSGIRIVRPLHAKAILIEGASFSIAYLGSANFSNRAWGLLSPRVGRNIEAGLILRRQGKACSALTALIPDTIGVPVPLSGAAKGHLALPVSSEPEEPWPIFLGELCLTPDTEASNRLHLDIRVLPEEIKGAWRVMLVGQTNDSDGILLEGNVSQQSLYRINLSPTLLQQLLRDQEVRVLWWIPQGDRNVPFNVGPSARDALPIVPGSTKPGESLLLAYYQGRIKFEELFPDPDSNAIGQPVESATANHFGVDTSRIQSYQVREFVEALRGIRDDLKQSANATPRAMRLALQGAVSPVALARAVASEVETTRRSPMAGAFQLFEILCCIIEARKLSTDEQHTSSWLAEIDQAAGIINELLDRLRSNYGVELGNAFSRYEKQLRTHYSGETQRQ